MSGPFTDVPIVKNRFSAIDDQVFIDRGKRISEYRGCFFKGHAMSAKIAAALRASHSNPIMASPLDVPSHIKHQVNARPQRIRAAISPGIYLHITIAVGRL